MTGKSGRGGLTIKLGKRTVLLCDCERSMAVDGKALAAALATDAPVVHTQLCRRQVDAVRAAVAGGQPLLIGCTQEAALFDDVGKAVIAETDIAYTNIRERAGWSVEPSITPKMSALLAEAALDREPTPALSLTSGGSTLVYGAGAAALAAARRLARRIEVTLLLTEADDTVLPGVVEFPIFRGHVRTARGHLGAFEVTVDGFGAYVPSSRSALRFEDDRDGVVLRSDQILDFSGGQPLVAGGPRRDGYVRVEPSDAVGLQRAIFDIADMVGEFEKPRYVRLDPAICAHARSGIVGCDKCLQVCPTQAITPAGDHVAIDPFVCAGHGACVSVCPTGAVAFDVPRGNLLFERLRTLVRTYHRADGRQPVLLIHDPRFGEEVIAMIARGGRGLPAAVVPFAVHEVTQVGLDLLLTALAYGVAQVRIIAAAAQAEALGPLRAHQRLIEAVMTGLGYFGDRVVVDVVSDPHLFETALYAGEVPAALARRANFLVSGDKRETLQAALRHLHAEAPRPVDVLALTAADAPFGRVVLDTERCTLCLACVRACPTSALRDNPETPELAFVEAACVQCGLCRNTCPERAITLEPRLDFTEAARARVVLKAEAPFRCVRCGKAFATPSAIDRMLKAMTGHPQFARPGALDLIKMCADCRVVAHVEDRETPFRLGERPVPRTTDDYLREREEAGRRGRGEDGSVATGPKQR